MGDQQRTILVVDDDEASLYAIGRFLRGIGYNVIAAADSFAALNALDGAQRIDCVVTDIVMPTGTPHGIALANMIRAKSSIQIVFMTGHADLAANITDNEVLLKPIRFEALAKALEAGVN